ncbi:hypothetical protein O3M35_006973 [Rhynocoris fuscipes]|uniref:sulfite oxidase n=1 Tax=Rhynocoris fuscipes TaxID=488301 RepID=A0AAW1DKN9_9HEMI
MNTGFRLYRLLKRNYKLFNIRITANFSSSYQENDYNQRNSNRQYEGYLKRFALITSVGLAFGVTLVSLNKDDDKTNDKYGAYIPNLPTYKMSEVAKHKDTDTRIWTTYRQGVYDITDYIHQHPGGSDVMKAVAGTSMDPYWKLYAFHEKNYIFETLERYRIGNLDKEDVPAIDGTDIWANEPKRHPSLKMPSEKPFCVEPQPQFLVQNYFTPNELFFVRNHLPVPDIDPSTYKLEVTGIGIDGTQSFTLEDIKKMPKHTINCAIQCCGNRRSEMSKIKMVEGLNWDIAAIGNAEWTGVRLCEFLEQLDICEFVGAEHVKFEGYDRTPQNVPFGSSMPLLKALDPRGEVLLAYEMNGEPLSRDHGFPLRLLIPGTAGARSVKWLAKIILSNEESDSHYYAGEYKGFSPNVTWENVDFSTAPAVEELPVISAICVPSDGCEVDLNTETDICVKGYSYSGGGRRIIRVDLTCDRGNTWHTANLLKEGKKELRAGQNHWDWTLWEANIPITEDLAAKKEFQIHVKAVDNSYSTQPECFRNIWNLRGIANVAYHKITIKVKVSKSN